MTDPPPDTDSTDDTGGAPGRGPTTSTPRWVKVFGVIGLVLVLLLVILLLIGRGHGPGRHMQSGEPGGGMPPSSVAAPGGLGDHASPVGGPW